MKILGFKISKENHFVNIVCNIFLCLVIVGVAAVSLYTPITSVSYLVDNQVYYSGNPNNNKVSIMINVYWGTEYILPMLDVLDSHKAKATFFVGGSWAADNAEILKTIYSKGHEIGNHGYYHKDHSKLNQQQNKEEILSCHNIVKNIIGTEMTLFAPPSGSYSKTTISTAKQQGYKAIMWSKDTIDWRDQNRDIIFSRATKDSKGGDLVLMHPTQSTLQALPDILNYYKSNNLIVATVSDNIA